MACEKPKACVRRERSLLKDMALESSCFMRYDYSDEELSLLAGFDTDSFNRWESMQRLGSKAVLSALAGDIESFQPHKTLMDAMRRILEDRTEDLSLILGCQWPMPMVKAPLPACHEEIGSFIFGLLRIAYALILPTESTLMQEATPPIDPSRLHQARNRVRKVISIELQAEMQKRYDELTADDEPYVSNSANWSRLQ